MLKACRVIMNANGVPDQDCEFSEKKGDVGSLEEELATLWDEWYRRASHENLCAQFRQIL